MPVPSSIADLSTTPGSNSPLGGESPSLIDDYIRTHASFIKVVSNAGDVTAATAAATAATVAGLPAPVDLTTNQTVNGSKSFVKGVGVAGEAADETGWTLTGYLRGLLLPATRAIWWAKGAATRSIGIVRQSGSNLLRFVSSTADDGTAAAFDALTVDAGTGNVTAAGTVFGGSTASFGDTTFRGAPGSTLSGIVIYEKPNTGSTLSGDVWSVVSSDALFIRENGGTNRGVQFDLSNAPAGAGGIIPFIVARGGTPSSGWRRWYLGADEFIIEQWGRSALQPDFSGVYTLGIEFPTTFLSSVDDVQMTIADEASGQTNLLAADWRRAATTLSTLNVRVRESGGAVQANFTIGFHAWGR